MIARLLRILAVCWAVASATMPGVLAVAEGVGESRAATTGIGHAEAPGSGACPLAHDAHCAVCSFLRHHAAVVADAPPADWQKATRGVEAARGYAGAPAAGHGSGRPRAPPAA